MSTRTRFRVVAFLLGAVVVAALVATVVLARSGGGGSPLPPPPKRSLTPPSANAVASQYVALMQRNPNMLSPAATCARHGRFYGCLLMLIPRIGPEKGSRICFSIGAEWKRGHLRDGNLERTGCPELMTMPSAYGPASFSPPETL